MLLRENKIWSGLRKLVFMGLPGSRHQINSNLLEEDAQILLQSRQNLALGIVLMPQNQPL